MDKSLSLQFVIFRFIMVVRHSGLYLFNNIEILPRSLIILRPKQANERSVEASVNIMIGEVSVICVIFRMFVKSLPAVNEIYWWWRRWQRWQGINAKIQLIELKFNLAYSSGRVTNFEYFIKHRNSFSEIQFAIHFNCLFTLLIDECVTVLKSNHFSYVCCTRFGNQTKTVER